MEDFTGQGLEDLRNGMIRTPLEPVETFSNTPLSILRSIRFATRFDFDLDPKMFEAIRDPRPRLNLGTKTSVEGRGYELVKMIGSKNAGRSVTLMGQFDVLTVLYAIPGAEDPHGYPELQEPGVQHKLIDQAEKICQITSLLFDKFSEEVENEKIKFSGRVIISNKAELKELQV